MMAEIPLVEKLRGITLQGKPATEDFCGAVLGVLSQISQRKVDGATPRVEAALKAVLEAAKATSELSLQWLSDFLSTYKSSLIHGEMTALQKALLHCFKSACLEQGAITMKEFQQKL